MRFSPFIASLVATTAVAQLEAAQIVQQIAPNAKNCAASNTDCRTAEQAAPYLVQAMQDHNIYCVNQMAATIALMAFESVDFQYKHNISPGRPGQGTANMQMAPYNLKYAQSLDGVKDQVAAITTTDGLSDDKLNSILALVTPDEYNFGSGPWFLATQCDQSVRDQLTQNADSGWQAYMGCVGVDASDPGRVAYWTRAKAAFGIK